MDPIVNNTTKQVHLAYHIGMESKIAMDPDVDNTTKQVQTV